MDLGKIIPLIEAIIYTAPSPMTTVSVKEAANSMVDYPDELSEDQVEACLEGIQEKYDAEFYPFCVRLFLDEWSFEVKDEYKKILDGKTLLL